jgi:hypothetical protein
MSADQMGRRIRDLESIATFRDTKGNETLRRLEGMLSTQKAEVRRLEDLVQRVKHGRKGSNGSPSPILVESPKSRRKFSTTTASGLEASPKVDVEKSLVVPTSPRPRSSSR